MKTVTAVIDTVIRYLSVVGALAIAVIFVLVVLDVLVRNLTGDSIHWASTIVEYGLLAAAMAVAPGLVRLHGHIRVEILSSTLPVALRPHLERLVCLAAAGLCLVLSWHAADAGYTVWQRGEVDIRSVPMPRWILYAVLTAGLFFCAIEYLREALSKTPGGAGHGAGEHGI